MAGQRTMLAPRWPFVWTNFRFAGHFDRTRKLNKRPGPRFSQGSETFRARGQILKSKFVE